MNTLPHFLVGLITGACIGFAALMEYIMRTHEPHDLPHRCDDGEQATTPPPAWENVTSATGDIDVLPIGEDHAPGTACVCGPEVEIIGAQLVIVHRSFDHREIIEQAIAIMNGGGDV